MTLDQKQAQLAHLIELKNSTENLSNVLQALEKQVNVMTTTAEENSEFMENWKQVFENLRRIGKDASQVFVSVDK